MSEPQPTPSAGAAPNRWWTKRSLVAHGALLIWVPGCAVAAWWQVGIALGGDKLGWIYSVMWPCFAVFGIIFWWFLVHDDPDSLGARGLRRMHDRSGDVTALASEGRDETIVQAENEDPELAAYNAYLAQLAHQPKSWRR